jgi:K+-sensing histidine kinase KdpD
MRGVDHLRVNRSSIPSKLMTEQQINHLLDRLTKPGRIESVLHQFLDVAIAMTGAEMGTLHLFDDVNEYLVLMASRGFSRTGTVFEAFRRMYSATSDGLGFGLFVVRRAADLLGHKIEVRSEAGRGSCFRY